MDGFYSMSMIVSRKALLRHYKNLVLHKAYADFRAEAARNYLGVAWWVIEPLINMAIYYLVFGIFLHVGGDDFLPYLLTGLVIWRFFDTTVSRAAASILSNMGLVRQTSFHKIIFPLIAMVTCSFEFTFSLALLFVVLAFYGYTITLYLIAFPLMFAILALFTLAMALPLAAIVPFVPDLMKPVQYGLRLAFYMSGVMYYVDRLHPKAQAVLQWNPMLHVIEGFRDLLLYKQWPDWRYLGIVVAVSCVLILFGVFLNLRMDPVYAKRVAS
ncbi:MAG TPA: ABC transporter permease [Candidatus Hydrogenedentes bacterium]|nr:ABC transporter permease [Candidatus Hydrogenedentota bacterium]